MSRKRMTIKDSMTNIDSLSLRKYLNDVQKLPRLTNDEEFEVAVLAKNGDEAAKTKLIESNLRFVITVAKQLINNNCKLDDLINEGNIGLIRAAETFDPHKGFKFISYAVWWIRQSITQYKCRVVNKIKLPSQRLTVLNKINEVGNQLTHKLDREPDIEEICDALDMDLNTLKRYTIYENARVDSYDSGILLELIKSNISSSDHKLLNEDMKYLLKSFLEKLDTLESDILRMFYGIDLEYPLSINEIGSRLSLNPITVKTIKDRSLFKLKQYSKKSSYNIGVLNDIYH